MNLDTAQKEYRNIPQEGQAEVWEGEESLPCSEQKISGKDVYSRMAELAYCLRGSIL